MLHDKSELKDFGILIGFVAILGALVASLIYFFGIDHKITKIAPAAAIFIFWSIYKRIKEEEKAVKKRNMDNLQIAVEKAAQEWREEIEMRIRKDEGIPEDEELDETCQKRIEDEVLEKMTKRIEELQKA